MREIQPAIRSGGASVVPCGGCTACCTASQFIHIGPDEAKTRSLIPAELLFPAPRWPAGHVVLGYDERGHCPMLIDNRCSIYEDRPKTCRTYDCRIFPATGVAPDGDEKVLIARQALRWRFAFPSEADRVRFVAVRAAAAFLEEHADALAETAAPSTPTQRAVLAIEVHELFLGCDETGQTAVVAPDLEAVRLALMRLAAVRRATAR
jgi:Fe-S-cluster containining protein